MNLPILTSTTPDRSAKSSNSPCNSDVREEGRIGNALRERHQMTPPATSSRRLRDNNNNVVANQARIFANYPKTPVRKNRTVTNSLLKQQLQQTPPTARTPQTIYTTSSRSLLEGEDLTESETYTHGHEEDEPAIVISNLHDLRHQQGEQASPSSSPYSRKSSSISDEDMAQKRASTTANDDSLPFSPQIIQNKDHVQDHHRTIPNKSQVAVGTAKNQHNNKEQQHHHHRRGRGKISKLPQSLSIPSLDDSSSSACESSGTAAQAPSTSAEQAGQTIQQCVIYKRSNSACTGITFGTSHDNHIVINALDPENSLCANKGLTIGMRLVRVNDTVLIHDPNENGVDDTERTKTPTTTQDHTVVDNLVNRKLKGEIILHFREEAVSEPPGLPMVEYETGMQDFFGRAMSETRAILNDRRRKGLGWNAKLRFRAKPPVWIRNHFDLYKDSQGLIYSDHKKLRDYGRVVWACLVMANSTMFDPRCKNDANPAIALYSPDPFYDRNLGDLDAISRNLFRLKGNVYEDPELQEFSQILASESKDIMSHPVPKVLTGGRLVFYTTLIIHRKHLPVPYLADRTFPLLIAPRYTTAAMILPKEYWSETAQSLWTT